jgi:hypothetical protein
MDKNNSAQFEDNNDPIDDDGAAQIEHWASRFRSFGKIVSDETTPREDIVNALADRLSLILEFYGCRPTMKGWRELALWLAMDFQFEKRKVIDVSTPVPNPQMNFERRGDKDGKSGRKYKGSSGAPFKRSRDNIIAREALKLLKSGDCISISQAAKILSEDKDLNLGLSVGRIKNIVTKQKNVDVKEPGNLRFLSYRPMLGGQMLEAAEMLTIHHEK